MNVLSIFLKKIIIFSMLWKILISLCPQKKIRMYGEALLGIYLSVYILKLIFNCFTVNYETEYWEKTEKIENNWKSYSDLFTITCEVKTELNNPENDFGETSKTLENTGVGIKLEKEENSP